MIIHIYFYQENSRIRQINSAISLLNCAQNYFHYVSHPSATDISQTPFVNWQTFIKNNPQINDYEIYITEKPFVDNWFSHESHNKSVITTWDWERQYAPPSLKSYIAYQIVQASLNFEVDLTESMVLKMVHQTPIGCIFDFCGVKTDIKIGMIAGNICSQCKAKLKTYGISEDAIISIENILEYIRREAQGKPNLTRENQAFVVMKFSENDENQNAYLYGIRSALNDLDIDCLRADDVIQSAPILQNVINDIKTSRFVIIAVNTTSLNVYFELGFAMALNKNILLVSDNEHNQNLPADLNNWTCLTYTKGNYKELKDKVIAYFQQNFYY